MRKQSKVDKNKYPAGITNLGVIVTITRYHTDAFQIPLDFTFLKMQSVTHWANRHFMYVSRIVFLPFNHNWSFGRKILKLLNELQFFVINKTNSWDLFVISFSFLPYTPFHQSCMIYRIQSRISQRVSLCLKYFMTSCNCDFALIDAKYLEKGFW